MTDDISKVEACKCVDCGGTEPGHSRSCTYMASLHDSESATTPAEVELPAIDHDEAFQRDYIPLGRSGWEIQTKGRGSTYRLCEPDGHRLAIPNEPYLHETLTRMARAVHADYATLARQLAKSERDCAELRALLTAQNAAIARTDDLARQLAEARALAYVMPDDPEHGLLTWKERTYEESAHAEQAESQLAEATRRLGEAEEVLRQIDAYHGPIRTPIHTITKLRGMARAALNKEPTK